MSSSLLRGQNFIMWCHIVAARYQFNGNAASSIRLMSFKFITICPLSVFSELLEFSVSVLLSSKSFVTTFLIKTTLAQCCSQILGWLQSCNAFLSLPMYTNPLRYRDLLSLLKVNVKVPSLHCGS